MNKQEFKKLIEIASKKSKIKEGILEKDFYITNILRELVKRNNDIIFKGGTSLSKAYKVINRFSEDVDITLKKEIATQSKIREFNKLIETVCYNELGLKPQKELQEKHPIRHKGMSNIYFLDYEPMFVSGAKEYIELDSSFITKVEKAKKIKIQPMIQDILDVKDVESLSQFEIYVQPIETIIADKFYAICKNYRRGNVTRYSRHFYDIYESYTKIIKGKTEEELSKYIREVAEAEKIKYSSNENVEVKSFEQVLLESCNSEAYKKDYVEDLPKYVYSEKMPTFEQCSDEIKKMIKKGMFSGLNHYFIKKEKNKNAEQKVFIYEFINAGI